MTLIAKTALQNKKIYLNYNNFRKQIFKDLAYKDSEAILYLLPWLMSINNPSFPGYIKNLKKNIKVFNVDLEREIMNREATFKKMFKFQSSGSLLRISPEICWIQGIYTIGSIGTIAQTSHSDCDIWVCID
jgi:adenylate cyclase class 1